VNRRSLLGVAVAVLSIAGAWLWMTKDDSPDPHRISLDVVVVPTGSTADMVLVRHIRCGGPRPHALCGTLRRTNPQTVRLDKRGICTTRDARPGYAKVSGDWSGFRVKETLRLSDRCEQARWRRLMPAFGLPDYR